MRNGPAPAPLALTMGEPAGIGGEITLKAWSGRGRADGQPLPPFFVIDDPERLARLARDLGFEVPIHVIDTPGEAAAVFPRALPVMPERVPAAVGPGRPEPANAPAVLAAIRRAVAFAEDGQAAAVVTNPVHKKTLYDAGFAHPGHTEYLAALTGKPGAPAVQPEMMLTCPGLRVVLATVHVALAEAVTSLNRARIVACGRAAAAALITDFAIARPRLAVAALNPHAGEGGGLGREEIEIIAPAMADLRDLGIAVTGPLPADSLFHAHALPDHDAVICMYHDQALIPLKTLGFDQGVNVTLGLPITRTSPDHGTAFDIAGTGRARETSLVAALVTAAAIAERREATRIGTPPA